MLVLYGIFSISLLHRVISIEYLYRYFFLDCDCICFRGGGGFIGKLCMNCACNSSINQHCFKTWTKSTENNYHKYCTWNKLPDITYILSSYCTSCSTAATQARCMWLSCITRKILPSLLGLHATNFKIKCHIKGDEMASLSMMVLWLMHLAEDGDQ